MIIHLYPPRNRNDHHPKLSGIDDCSHLDTQLSRIFSIVGLVTRKRNHENAELSRQTKTKQGGPSIPPEGLEREVILSAAMLSFSSLALPLIPPDPHSADRRNSKTRPRRRHEHPQRPADLSVFTVAGGRVLSGWHKRNAVTIDTEDIAFQRALEPLERRPRPFPNRPPSGPPHIRRPPRQALRGPINQNASSTSRVVDPVPDEKTRHRIAVDFDIPLLSSGLVYATSSYLGKGWLHELLSIVSGTPPSHPPPAVEVDGHMLSSVSTALDYTVFLPYSRDSFAKVLDNPLAMSREAFTNWNANMHAVCSLVSWILASAVGDGHQ